jgi:hypothetical protein
MSSVDEYKEINDRAKYLGKKFGDEFWAAVDAWDNSGWLGEHDNDAWGQLCKEKYYDGLCDVIERYDKKLCKREKKKERPCKHFLNGTCKFGDKCKYPHSTEINIKANNSCKFYLEGSCKFGDQCKYLH